MPKTSKATASETVEVEGYEGHVEKLDGGYTVAFERYTADADLSSFFKGLPDDRCQCRALGLRHPRGRWSSGPPPVRRPSRPAMPTSCPRDTRR